MTVPTRLLARIELEETEDFSAGILEFPVRHINVRPSDYRFQVETGPILVALRGDENIEDRLRRAYIAFSGNDEATLIVDSNRAEQTRTPWEMIVQVPIKDTFYAVDE